MRGRFLICQMKLDCKPVTSDNPTVMAKRWLLLYPAIFLVPASLAASGGGLTAYGPAHLSGFTDGKTPVALTTQVNLGSAVAIESLVLDPAPLKGDNGVILDRSNVKLTSPVKFGVGEILPVGITVSGLVRPGTYTGAAVFRDAKAASSVQVDIEATLVGKPVLKVATDGLSALTCLVKWSCEVGEQWLGGRKVINLTNEGAGPAEIGEAHVVLRATRGAKVLDDATLRPEVSSKDLPFSGTIRLNVPNDLPADRYQGIVRVSVKNADEAPPTPITLDVRHGPWVALLVLAAGILLGRHAARWSRIPAVGQLVHAAIRLGLADAWTRASVGCPHCELCGRLRNRDVSGRSRRGDGSDADDDGETPPHGE